MYRSEAAFSAALCKLLTSQHIWHQRIESALTGRGIPDLYVRQLKRERWVELKNCSRMSVYDAVWKIPWRKGQQAWAQEYRRHSGLCAYTFVAFKDGFIVIPMTEVFRSSLVPAAQIHFKCTKLNDLLEVFI